MQNKKFKLIGPFICLLTAIIWGSGFPFQDKVGASADIIDGFSFNGLRFLIAGVVLIPVFLIFEREAHLPREYRLSKLKSTAVFGIISGALLAVSSSLQQFGIQMTGESGRAGFITGLYLIIVPIAAFIIFKQKPSVFVWVAIPFSLAGLYFLSVTNGFNVEVGDLLVLLCAFGFASQIIFVDKVGDRVSVLKFSCVQFFSCGVICMILGLIFGNLTWQGINDNLFAILYCGVMSAGAAYTLQNIGQRFTPPAIASLLFATEGLFATVFECIVETEVPSGRAIIGCLLMLTAVILSQIPKKQKTPN
ncbi:MAG: DMT family transporter [Ruminococcaceae bacterium]|nr:DMT family transporter [Oscillospiraceae bacterium]